jgi:hypothetical protein
VESTSGEETVNKDVIVMDMGHVTLKQGIVYVLLGGRERSVRLHVVREHMDQTVAFFVTVRMGLLRPSPCVNLHNSMPAMNYFLINNLRVIFKN